MCQRDEERGAGQGPSGREEDHRSSSLLRGGEDDGGWGLGLLREERTALLVQIVHQNFTEPQGVPLHPLRPPENFVHSVGCYSLCCQP